MLGTEMFIKRLTLLAVVLLVVSFIQAQTLEVSPNGLYHTLESKSNPTF
jgi:hypothetical protein